MAVANVDAVWNGVWQLMKIANPAEAQEVNVAPHDLYGHLCSISNVHFATFIPNLQIMEIDIDLLPWDDEQFTHKLEFEASCIIVPDRLAWGCDANEEALVVHSVTGAVVISDLTTLKKVIDPRSGELPYRAWFVSLARASQCLNLANNYRLIRPE